MRSITNYTIFDTSDFTQAAFTVTAATDVIASTAHGLKVGDVIEVKAQTTLPTGMSAATPYYVISVPTVDSFKVSATKGGTTINIEDTGTGTLTWLKQGAGKSILVKDFNNITLGIDTDGGADAAMTFKVVVSQEEECVDFDKAQSTTNSYSFAAINDLDDGTAKAGSDGVVVATADINKKYSVNTDSISWITVKVSGRTEGEARVIISATNNQ